MVQSFDRWQVPPARYAERSKATACAPLDEVDTTVAAKAAALNIQLPRDDQNGKIKK